MKHISLIFLAFFILQSNLLAQEAVIKEELLEMKTYPFSDPDPVPEINRIYPYFDFDGYTAKPEVREWKMVVLENDYIKVYVCPDIGGKVWGAIEKSTGEEFLYFNHVVKFRDVAMRGPWTSGGLEYNFGDIGHIPTCATPVDYVMKENKDGSVSCVVGATDLPSGTTWSVEVIVHPDKAYFETLTRWFNNTSLPCTYYHWMNAAAKSAGNLEFIYPGTNYIGHGGEVGEWPAENGRKLNYYENNNFGSYKSYHVLNSYADFFGGYYHDDDFGFGHRSDYDDKPGKKLWIWGLSEQGMIWEDLLTDDDGQYIEFQAGKLFNQADEKSTYTPFRHKEFAPHDTDVMREMWFPLKGTGGMVAASESGILNIEDNDGRLRIIFSSLIPIRDKLIIKEGDQPEYEFEINLAPLEKAEFDYESATGEFRISLGDELLHTCSKNDRQLNRPLLPLPDFNWESAYGLYTKALELEKQRMFDEAIPFYERALEKDPGFLPAITRLAMGHYRQMNYEIALDFVLKSLAIDTYDGEANYLFGLINNKLGNGDDSKSGFSIAASSPAYRSAAYVELSGLFCRESDYLSALDYADKALSFNAFNKQAYQLRALVNRKSGNRAEAARDLTVLYDLDATNHFIRFEELMAGDEGDLEDQFKRMITNELPHESYLDLAIFYFKLNCVEEAVRALTLAPSHPVRDIWLARLDQDNSTVHLQNALNASPEMVFPYRNETAVVLEEMVNHNEHWKLKYYLGLIYWNRGLEDKARELFNACGMEPDFAPFYLASARLTMDEDAREKFLQRAYTLDKNDWRPALELAESYLAGNQAGKALALVEDLTGRYPEQSSITLAYARILMKLEKYDETVSFLESCNVLPFEGATAGRDLYHEACIKMAYRALDNKQYKDVIDYAKKALSWPVNLGVGKPYDVDEQLEKKLISQGYDSLNQEQRRPPGRN